MREGEYRTVVVGMLRPLRAFSVENSAGTGCPDICTLAGWVEMKLGDLPRKLSTPVRVGMRPAQRVWHRGWRRSGGRSVTLCIVDDAWIINDGLWSADHLDNSTFQTMTRLSIAWWMKKPPASELIQALVKWDHRFKETQRD